MLCQFSCVQLFATITTIAHQAPLSMGFPGQEYQSGLPHAPPGETLPDPGNEPMSLRSPALEVGLFTTSITWEVPLLFLVFPFKRIEVVQHFFETLCSESPYFKMRALLGLCGHWHHCNCSVLLPLSPVTCALQTFNTWLLHWWNYQISIMILINNHYYVLNCLFLHGILLHL